MSCSLNFKGVEIASVDNSKLFKELETYFEGDINKATQTWLNSFQEDSGFINEKTNVPSNELMKDFKGKEIISSAQKLVKGVSGKFKSDGSRLNVHEGTNGIFATHDVSLAEQYQGELPLKEFTIPPGSTIEYLTAIGKGLTIEETRKLEVELINNSTSDIVKLDLIDKSGRETQFIIKDEAIIKSSKDFEKYTLVEPTLEESLILSEIYNTNEAVLDINTKVSVISSMRHLGIEDSKDLLDKLNKTFRSKGYFELDVNKIKKSGLYSVQEVNSIVSNPNVSSKIAKTIRELDNSESFKVNINNSNNVLKLKNPNKKGVLGNNEIIPISKIEKDLKLIGANTDTKEDFISELRSLEYSGLIMEMEKSSELSEAIYNDFGNYTKIPAYEFVRGRLQPVEQGISKTTLALSMLEGVSSKEIIEDIDFVKSINQEAWIEVQEDLSTILKEIEKEATDFNIDIVGLSEKTQDREGVIKMLEDLADVTLLLDKKALDDSTLSKYVESYNELFKETDQSFELQKLDKYPENTVYVRTTATDTKMFDEFGLVNLGDGYYHAVDMEIPVEELESFLDANIQEERLTHVKDQNKRLQRYIKIKEKESFSKKGSTDYYDETGLSFRLGDLKVTPEKLGKFRGGRGTGHYGTGFYFTGYEQTLNEPSDNYQRELNTVDFRAYNLLRVKNNSIGLKLHDVLKSFQGLSINSLDNVTEDEKMLATLKTNGEIDNYKVKVLIENLVLSIKSEIEVDYNTGNLKGYYKEDDYSQDDIDFEISRVNFNEDNILYQLEKLDKGYTAFDKRYSFKEIFQNNKTFPKEYLEKVLDSYYKNLPSKKEVFKESLVEKLKPLAKIVSLVDINTNFKDNLQLLKEGIVSKLRRDSYQESHMRKTTLGTELIKLLGYNGIDVRGVGEQNGMTGLDNFSYGSVIYDLENTIQGKKPDIQTFGDEVILNKTLEEVKTKELPFETINAVKYNLYSEMYGYSNYKSTSNLVLPTKAKVSVEYLKEGFKDDLYNYILKEKVKDSELYNSVLSNISIAADGINISEDNLDLLDLVEDNEILENLKIYGAIRKNSGFDFLNIEGQTNPYSHLFEELNTNPKKIEDQYIQEGDFIITNEFENFIQVGNDLYQNLGDSLFFKLGEKNPIFNTLPLTKNIEVPTEVLNKVLEFNNTKPTSDITIEKLTSDFVLKETEKELNCNG